MSNKHSDDLSRDAEDLHEALAQLLRVYQFRDRDRICCHDVSVTQCYAVEALVKQGSLRLQVLAEQMFLDKSTASRVVDILERKGYVARVEDPEDRRAVQVQATEAGVDLSERIRASLIAEEKAMIKLPAARRTSRGPDAATPIDSCCPTTLWLDDRMLPSPAARKVKPL